MKQTAIVVIVALFALAHSPGAQPTFTDVTSSAGVANSLPGQQRLGTSCAWGDYDGDGDVDLYVTNWGSSVSQSFNRLYQNTGSAAFSDVAQSAGVADAGNSVSAAWVDYDNDGDLDLYVVNFFEQDQLYQNNGSGRFSRATGSAGVNVISQGDESGAAWGDYDGDGDLDLYICKYYFRNSLYHNNGSGSFSEVGVTAGVADIRDSEDAAWADYDDDGDLDLYVVNREQNNAFYKNNGDGSFSDVAGALSLDNTDVGRSARWVDFDRDGDLDLFLANVGANALYRNDGGSFVDVADGDMKSISGAWVSWIGAWGDFDADGWTDVFVANGAEAKSGQVSPLLRNNNGIFSDVTAASGISAAGASAMSAGVAYYDGDCDLDLYVVNSRYPTFEANQLYRNNQR